MKNRIAAVAATIALAGATVLAGAGAANAAPEPKPDWGPGWCFVWSGGGWYGYGCPVKTVRR